MPVRINLKELFGSDSQELTVDKLNFNFNKLLELGVGLKGARGITGGTGSIGPHGVQGLKGDKGNQWFVGSGNPNGQSFPNLMDEDFFVNSDQSQIWQYDIDTDSWVVVVDISAIVTNFLAISGTTFVRGYGNTSPHDSRYIVFPNRGNSTIDFNGDGLGSLGSSSNNDILYLSNFNEKHPEVITISNDPDSDDFYSAIQKTFVDYSSGVSGRYHSEYGSLFSDTNNVLGYGAGAFLVSELSTNLKIRHQVDDISGDLLYKGIFSMTVPENQAPGTIVHNGILDFQLPKYSATDVINDNISIQFGSRYGLEGIANYSRFDGINFTATQGRAGLGISTNYDTRDSNITMLSDIKGKHYFLLDTDDSNVDEVFIDSGIFQDSGNIRQLGTSIARDVIEKPLSLYGLASGSTSFASSSIVIFGNTLYHIEGWNFSSLVGSLSSLNTAPIGSGVISRWDITDTHNIKVIEANTYSSITGSYNTGTPTNVTRTISGVGLSDIDVAGDYVYLVNNHSVGQYDSVDITAGTNVSQYWRRYFQIGRVDKINPEKISLVGYIGVNSDTDVFDTSDNISLDGAYRIQTSGSYAIVATNKLRTFGNSDTSNLLSHWGNSTNGKGYITAVNITDPKNPHVSVFIQEDRSHHLDLAVSEDFAASITLKVGVNPGDNVSWSGHTVNVNVYKLDHYTNNSPMTISLSGSHQILSSASLLNIGNSQTNSIINKFGSINIDGRNIYALYKNVIWKYTRYEEGNGNSGFEFKSSAQFNGTNADTRVLDSKLVGRSIYVLVSEGGTNSYDSTDTFLIKISIDSKSGIHTVWKKSLGNPWYSSMDITGGRIYLHRSDIGSSKVRVLEVDSIEADHANISNIKIVDANISRNLTIGNNLNVKSGINVGSNGIVSEGSVISNGDLGNISKIWHSGSGTTGISGVSGGIIAIINDRFHIYPDKNWRYIITATGKSSVIEGSSRFLVSYSSGVYNIREISYTASSARPELSLGLDNQFILHTSSTNTFIEYTIESIYSGEYGSSHLFGSDNQWRQVGSYLYYDGVVDVKNEFRVSNFTDSSYIGFVAPLLSPNVTYTLPSIVGTTGQVLSRGSGNTLTWNDSGIYETLDGNGIKAEANYAYDILIRNSDDTGYEWVPIGTIYAALEEIKSIYDESTDAIIPLGERWNLSYSVGALEMSFGGGPVTWNGVAGISSGNRDSDSSGYSYYSLNGANIGTNINFRIPDIHPAGNNIRIEISTFLTSKQLVVGTYAGSNIVPDSSFTYTSQTGGGSPTIINKLTYIFSGNPGDLATVRIYSPGIGELGILSIDISG